MLRPLLILSATVTCICAVDPVSPPTNLVSNGDFTAGWTGWAPNENDKKAGQVALASEDGNTYLHLAKPLQVLPAKRIAIDPTWKKLHVSCRIRAAGLQTNDAISYGNARLANSFVMPEGKRKYLGIVQVKANTDPAVDGGWAKLTTTAEIPAGALEFEVACGNFGLAGQTDFDDIVVTAE
jgi:hypothetical protein